MPKTSIESIAFGGDGVCRCEGLVTFIPFTAPGDLVEFTYTAKKKNFAFGKALEILEESPFRTQAFCPYFGVCGGCQLQHLQYQKQLEIKKRFIEDALQHIGKIFCSLPQVVPADGTRAYREHITLKVHKNQFGYTQADGKTFLPIEECPIFLESHHPFFTQLKIFLNEMSPLFPLHASIRCVKGRKDSFLLSITTEETIAKKEELISFLRNFLSEKSLICGIGFYAKNMSFEGGDLFEKKNLLGLEIFFHVRSFLQNHAHQAQNLYSYIDRIIPSSPYLLDLYCGIGITTLLLAKKGGEKVIGVENNPQALQCAQKSLAINALENVTFIQEDVEKVLKSLLKEYPFETVLLNPPRTGLSPSVLEALKEAQIPQIVYISCMPSTLARDLAQLVKNGYCLDQICGFDMFPQTTHVETVVSLKKINPASG